MALRPVIRLALGSATLALGFAAATVIDAQEAAQPPIAVSSSRVSIAGTSNIHAYTASTTAVRVTRLQIAKDPAGSNLWDAIVKPGAIEAFEVSIAAATLSSPKEGLDKNMHKALKVTEHPEIVFNLRRVEPRAGTQGGLIGVGVLRIAGIEREVSLELTTERRDHALIVRGSVPLLMTDYGIKPPVAMLGMLKTDPKVTVNFETVLAASSTPTSTIH
jgi:polyisoprenoid-binding protein YceI